MASAAENLDQQHPQYNADRDVVSSLLKGEATDYNLAELARLKIRYQGFPGARDIQSDLEKVMNKWNINESELYEKTRIIHAIGNVYKSNNKTQNDEDDWT